MDKVALITGAARGIGKQIAITLAKEGYNIALNYRTNTDSIIELKDHSFDNGVCSVCGCRKPSEGLDYTLVDNTYYIVNGIGDCTDTVVVIPSTYERLPVKEIAEKAFLVKKGLVTEWQSIDS